VRYVNDRDYVTPEQLEQEEAEMIEEYRQRYLPQTYRQVFYPPPGGPWEVDAQYVDGFFQSGKLLLEGLASGQLLDGYHGVVAVHLCRHYLELAIKYALFHSRWLKSENENALDEEIAEVQGHHNLHTFWGTLKAELKKRIPSVLKSGLDLEFVDKIVAEFHRFDEGGWQLRYPRKVIGVVPHDEPLRYPLGVHYGALLYDITHVHDVLDTLDRILVEQHGENDDWQAELNAI
jgi:hypothetical protein